MLELMTHKDLQAACDATQKLLMSRWPFIAFGVVDKRHRFRLTGNLFANKFDRHACSCLMSGLSKCVEKLIHMPPAVKKSSNNNDDPTFKGFKLMFPLASLGDCCAHVLVTGMPENGANASLMIQRTLRILTTI